jgi:tetratricopeptide (TPR) repeat protein
MDENFISEVMRFSFHTGAALGYHFPDTFREYWENTYRIRPDSEWQEMRSHGLALSDTQQARPLDADVAELADAARAWASSVTTAPLDALDIINLEHVATSARQNLANAHYNLGVEYHNEGKHDEAIKECQEALSIDPNHANAHCILGLVYYTKGKHDEAIEEYQKALRIDPNGWLFHYNLGVAYYAQGRYDEAIAEYRETLRINQNDADAHCGLGAAYHSQGKLSEAIDCYQAFVRLAPPTELLSSARLRMLSDS